MTQRHHINCTLFFWSYVATDLIGGIRLTAQRLRDPCSKFLPPKLNMNLKSAGKCLSKAQWREISLVTGFKLQFFDGKSFCPNSWSQTLIKQKNRDALWARWDQRFCEISLCTIQRLIHRLRPRRLPRPPRFWTATVSTVAPEEPLGSRSSSPFKLPI